MLFNYQCLIWIYVPILVLVFHILKPIESDTACVTYCRNSLFLPFLVRRIIFRHPHSRNLGASYWFQVIPRTVHIMTLFSPLYLKVCIHTRYSGCLCRHR